MGKKSNIELVNFARSKVGTDYVYGAKGEILSLAKYLKLKKMYKEYVPDTDETKVGKFCVDCSGLISWCTGIQKSSSMYKNEVAEIFPINTVEDAPIGAAVWRQGHIGIYIGGGRCIEARGSKYGVVISNLKERNFTHWFRLNDIEYVHELYYPKYAGNSQSLVDALNSLGIDSSKQNRLQIANANGFENYLYLAEQNGYLLALLKEGKLKKYN